MNALRRRVHDELLSRGVVAGHDAAPLHRHVLVTVLAEVGGDDAVGAGKRAVDISERADGGPAEHVVAEVVEHWWARRIERGLGVGHGREGLVVDRDELTGVLGQVTALGHDERDRIADQAHLVGGEERVVGSAPARHHHRHRVRPTGQELLHLLAGVDGQHAGRLLCRGRVDARDARVRERAAHERAMKHLR